MEAVQDDRRWREERRLSSWNVAILSMLAPISTPATLSRHAPGRDDRGSREKYKVVNVCLWIPWSSLGSVRHLEYALLMAYVVIRFLISIHIVLSYGAVIPRGNMHSISSMIGRAGDNASDRPCMQFKTSGIVDALLTSRFRLLHFGIQ